MFHKKYSEESDFQENHKTNMYHYKDRYKKKISGFRRFENI